MHAPDETIDTAASSGSRQSKGQPLRSPLRTMLGLIVVVAMIGGCATAASAGAVFTRTHDVCAEFTDSVGVYKGNSVMMLGIQVGTVTGITEHGDRVRMTMSVDDSLRLPADVGAVTLSSSIATDRHVEFSTPYRSGPHFNRANCIPLSRTKTPLGISETFDSVTKLTSSLSGGTGAPDRTVRPSDGTPDSAIAQTLATINRSLSGTAPELNAAVGQLATLVGNPAQRDGVIRRLIVNVDSLLTTLLDDWPDVKLLLDNLKNGLQAAAGISRELGNAVDLTKDFVPILARNIKKYDKQIYSLLDVVTPVVGLILNRVADIADILSRLPAVAGGIERAGTNVRDDVSALQYRPPAIPVDSAVAAKLCATTPKRCSIAGQPIPGLAGLVMATAGVR